MRKTGWVPFAFRGKEPCKHCGTRSYISAHINSDGLFCSETCGTTYHWQQKFRYHERQADDTYSIRFAALKPSPSNE